ncbi:SHOCT domain-containing protein [Natrinema salifodinae]|uniref:Short C-terminal domain-containing protein n=1 Tax=Natrinema salifodinae TaxID=1202768 RepID=A0A1I0MZU8_9EURY|nr:SHOCT domain-containing protein [Natrinema salifodinae]SEV94292.1 Short C-terminal domain-containing protein [Natrinema salifodinae]
MASGSDGGREYSLVELFAIKFVLADVLIIAVLLLSGPLYAILLTALLVLGGLLLWYLVERAGTGPSNAVDADRSVERPADYGQAGAGSTSDFESDPDPDPVTILQERYAAGELTETEFEAKLDRLLEADERAEAAGVETESLSLERTD